VELLNFFSKLRILFWGTYMEDNGRSLWYGFMVVNHIESSRIFRGNNPIPTKTILPGEKKRISSKGKKNKKKKIGWDYAGGKSAAGEVAFFLGWIFGRRWENGGERWEERE